MKSSKILLLDAIINLLLGLLLLFYTTSIVKFLGVPLDQSSFYPNILGGILFGIGIALLIEYFGRPVNMIGLGIDGAIAINLCGGFVLAFWLILGNLTIPLRGYIFLWSLVILLIGISSSEFVISRKKLHSE